MKKKGFTLVEIVVALACATIILASITSVLYFLSSANKEIIDESSDLYKITIIRDEICRNSENINDIEINANGDVIIKGKTIVYNSSVTSIKPDDEKADYIIITYGNGEEYRFRYNFS